jgi:hypothetical protein
MSKPAKINWIRWKDVCQSLLMVGAMKDFSRSECRRVATLLRNGVAAGTVLHKKESSLPQDAKSVSLTLTPDTAPWHVRSAR